MPLLYEDLNVKSLQVPTWPTGWERTLLLAGGAAAGVLVTAFLMHIIKGGKPEVGIKGWPRTLLLTGGAFCGTMLTAAAIHAYKQAELPIVKEI